MPITVSDPLAERGKKDARRHREKQREAIRARLPELIAEEAIITGRRGKTVKVPIRSIDIPHFRPGSRNKGQGDGEGSGGVGVGQGPGAPGDVIGRRPSRGQKQGPEAGDEPGHDYIETEIELEELIHMMLEDLGLPRLERKEVAELESICGVTIRGIKKSGPRPLLDPRRSSRTAFGRFFAFLDALMEESGRDEAACSYALREADGDFARALQLLLDPTFRPADQSVEPFGIYHEGDLRFHKVQEEVLLQSNAVVIAMMDVSGSMTAMKKYIARSLLFWMVEFLRTIYTRVEIRFIIHHNSARLVPEEEFFHTGESGGTRCASAYQLTGSLIDSQYPTDRWNVYGFHFSDGEDFAPQDSTRELKKLIDKGINMFGYGEIHVDEYYRSYTNLLPAFKDAFAITERKIPIGESTLSVSSGNLDFPFFGVVIEDRSQIWPALKEFLQKNRWS